MKKNNTLIIGCSIPSLYAATKLLQYGYKVTIVERRKNIFPISETIFQNYKVFNQNHTTYINLLKQYSIDFQKIENIVFNQDLYKLINDVIEKSKQLHNITSYTFKSLCDAYSFREDLENLKSDSNELLFEYFFNKLNAADCINILSSDITNTCDYYSIDDAGVNNIITSLLQDFKMNGGNIVFNFDVKHIKYIKKRFIVTSVSHEMTSCDILFTTISKNNLSIFSFWNPEQRILLNSVNAVSSTLVRSMIDSLFHLNNNSNIFELTNQVQQYLLHNHHVVYPIFTNKHKYIYIWNNNTNNVKNMERIKHIYNDNFYICSESFTKNNMFVNYSLESVDKELIKLCRHM